MPGEGDRGRQPAVVVGVEPDGGDGREASLSPGVVSEDGALRIVSDDEGVQSPRPSARSVWRAMPVNAAAGGP